MRERALVAGAGYVGEELARRLLGAGYEVTVLRRSACRPPPGAQAFRADLACAGSLEALPPHELVFYLVAADARDDAAYAAAYVTGIGRLLERLGRHAAPPHRLLFASSTAVYGQQAGEWVDERSATEPRDFAGRRLLEGEGLVLAAPFPTTCLRLAGIYGPGRSSLVERVRSGAARCRTGAPHFTNRIHRDDAAAAFLHLAALPSAASVIVGVDHAPAPENEVLCWLAARLGVPEPPRVGTEEAPRRATNKRCSGARLLATGFRFRYPTYREGYEALLRGGDA